MKVNPILLVVALALSALITYALCCFTDSEHVLCLAIGCFTMLSSSNIALLGISYEQQGSAVNMKIVAGLFGVLFFISNFIFSFFLASVAPYIVVNGILFLLFIIFAYYIIKANM